MEQLLSAFKRYPATIIAGVVVIFVLVLSFVLVFARIALPAAESAELVVRIHDGAGQTHEFPLENDERYPIQTELGSNTVVVQNGRVWIEEADCPNGDCLRQAPLERQGPQLICLPHQLWLEIVPSGSEDNTLDESSVSPTPDDIDILAR